MCLLVGQGSNICALLCSLCFLHPRHCSGPCSGPCIMQTSQYFAISAMDVEHIDTYTPSTVVNFKRSEGTVVLARIPGPSEHGAEYSSIPYKRSGSMVTHDCAPIAQMPLPLPHNLSHLPQLPTCRRAVEVGHPQNGHGPPPPPTMRYWLSA